MLQKVVLLDDEPEVCAACLLVDAVLWLQVDAELMLVVLQVVVLLNLVVVLLVDV